MAVHLNMKLFRKAFGEATRAQCTTPGELFRKTAEIYNERRSDDYESITMGIAKYRADKYGLVEPREESAHETAIDLHEPEQRDAKELSAWIRSLRGRLGDDRETFALRFGVRARTVERWESVRSHHSPGAETLDALRKLEESIGESME